MSIIINVNIVLDKPRFEYTSSSALRTDYNLSLNEKNIIILLTVNSERIFSGDINAPIFT